MAAALFLQRRHSLPLWGMWLAEGQTDEVLNDVKCKGDRIATGCALAMTKCTTQYVIAGRRKPDATIRSLFSEVLLLSLHAQAVDQNSRLSSLLGSNRCVTFSGKPKRNLLP